MKNRMILDSLKSIGIDVALTIAGLAGGLATLMKNKALKWSEKVVILLSGGFSANYITPLLADFINVTENAYLGVAFFVGYGGLKFVEKIFVSLHKKMENEKTDN